MKRENAAIRLPAGKVKDFSRLQNVKTGSGTYQLFTGCRRKANPSPPSSIQTRLRMSGAVALRPLSAFVAEQGQFFLYLYPHSFVNKIWLVNITLKYLNLTTLSKDLLPVFCPNFFLCSVDRHEHVLLSQHLLLD